MNITKFDLQLHGYDVPPGDYNYYQWALAINHASSASRFWLRPNTGTINAPYVVEGFIATDSRKKYYLDKWDAVLEVASEWANDLKDYVDTPDLWTELRVQRELLAESRLEALENTVFTLAEQVQITEQLREVKEYLRENLSLTIEQMARIEAKIDEAEAASRRLGRKDWLLLFLGTTVSLFATDLVPATAIQHITVLVLQGLGHLFGFGMGPPPLSG